MSIERGYGFEEQLRRLHEQEKYRREHVPKFKWPPIEKPNPEVIKRRRKRLLVNAMNAHIDIGHATGLMDSAEQVRHTHGLHPDEAALIDDVIVEVQQLLPRLTRAALARLVAAQPEDPDRYNLRAAKKILTAAGFADSDLTDENVKQIVDYRHLLLTLKEPPYAH